MVSLTRKYLWLLSTVSVYNNYSLYNRIYSTHITSIKCVFVWFVWRLKMIVIMHVLFYVPLRHPSLDSIMFAFHRHSNMKWHCISMLVGLTLLLFTIGTVCRRFCAHNTHTQLQAINRNILWLSEKMINNATLYCCCSSVYQMQKLVIITHLYWLHKIIKIYQINECNMLVNSIILVQYINKRSIASLYSTSFQISL